MAFGATSTDSNGIPLGSVQAPGVAAPVPLQGGTTYLDSQGNTSSPVSVSPVDSWKATYAVSLLAIAPVATPTDWVVLQGSASKIIHVVQVIIGGIATTAGGITYQYVFRTAANTGGTSGASTITKFDQNAAVPTGAPVRYTANATGLGAGNPVFAGHLALPLAATPSSPIVQSFGNIPAQAVTVRGVSQFFAVNLNASALPAGTALDLTLIWTEE